MPKLTKRLVEGIKPDPDRDVIVWDQELPGFGIRVWPSGKRVYILKYRNMHGRQRKPVIGQHGVLTADQARSIARGWLAEVERGGDPSGSRVEARTSPTMDDLAERYLEQHARVKKRPRSVKSDETLLQLHILPPLGRMKVSEVGRADVQRLHHNMRATPGAANRTAALLSKMFNLAEKWGLRPDVSNPCRHLEKYRERKLERFLSEAELARLGDVLNEAERFGSERPSVIAAIRLLIFTGCRLSEILTLRWEYVDFERQVLRLPESKTGQKVVPLNAPARELLTGMTRDPSGWVIPGAKIGAHLVNLEKPWRRIRAKAGLDDVRLHDLRHSFASFGAASGLSLPIIGALLGHTQAATTKRYAHLADDPLRQASEAVGQRIAAAMKGESGEVVPMERR